jgi:hypothetical protein
MLVVMLCPFARIQGGKEGLECLTFRKLEAQRPDMLGYPD